MRLSQYVTVLLVWWKISICAYKFEVVSLQHVVLSFFFPPLFFRSHLLMLLTLQDGRMAVSSLLSYEVLLFREILAGVFICVLQQFILSGTLLVRKRELEGFLNCILQLLPTLLGFKDLLDSWTLCTNEVLYHNPYHIRTNLGSFISQKRESGKRILWYRFLWTSYFWQINKKCQHGFPFQEAATFCLFHLLGWPLG